MQNSIQNVATDRPSFCFCCLPNQLRLFTRATYQKCGSILFGIIFWHEAQFYTQLENDTIR